MEVIIKFFLKIKNLINIQNFKLRLVSTVFLLTIFFILFLLGNPTLPIFFVFVLSAVLYEFFLICKIRLRVFNILGILVFPVLLFIYSIININDFNTGFKYLEDYHLFLLLALCLNIYFLFVLKNFFNILVLYLIIISFFSLINILFMPNGLNYFLYLVVLVTTMDVFAYVGGNIFGNYKIAPNISKGKTIEGTLIGIIFTIIVSFFLKELIDLTWFYSIIIGLIIALLSFLGDLLESLFKRNIGIKDSGSFIPGHGGLLDRFDGYILVLPLSNFFLIN